MRVYAVELDGVLADTPADLTGERATASRFAELFQINPYRDNVAVMSEWVYSGLVPSIVTRRPPETRSVTEAWCSKNTVPYSNFLLGVEFDDISPCLYHIDADFYVTDDVNYAIAAAESEERNIYVVRREWNAGDEDSVTNVYENIVFINKLRNLTKLEGIKS